MPVHSFLALGPCCPTHGAAVRGSRYGSLVRVGENFTDENITPVGRNGAGSGAAVADHPNR